MTVSKPIVAAPSKSRAATRMVIGKITGTEPPGTRFYVANGGIALDAQAPEREGQMLFYQAPNSGQNVIMYVVVDYDGQGTLQWAPVVPNTIAVDLRTGKPKDPLYDFYGLHSA